MTYSEDSRNSNSSTSQREPQDPYSSAEQALLSGSEEGLRGLVLAERYQILERIGSGGWGTVFKAKHLTLESLVAIKLLHAHMADDEDVKKRFEHEANILSKVDSRYVVKTIDLIFKPVPYIVMEYFPGIPLSKLLETQNKLEFPLAVELFRQICEGLQAAHAAGLVHRDLKPANILVEIDRDSLKSKILDFGLAKFLDEGVQEKLTSTGEVLGSPPFMAPEQWSGRGVDQRTDIYALGCIMYQVICGRQAFIAEYGLDYLKKHLHEEPSSFKSVLGKAAKEIPPQFELLVRKCMAKTQERRYSSASEILQDIDLLQSGNRISIKDERSAKQHFRNTIIVALAIAILLGIFGTGFLQRETIIAAYCKRLNEEAGILQKDPKRQTQAEEKYRTVISLSGYLANAQDKNKLHAMHSLVSLLKSQNRSKEYTDLNKQLQLLIGEDQSSTVKELSRFAHSFSGENLQTAEQNERRLLEEIAKRVGRHSVDYAEGLALLSQCKNGEQDYKSAIQYGRESLKIEEDLLEPDDPKIADKLSLLGRFLLMTMQTEESEQIFLRLVDIARKTCPDRLAEAYNGLGVVYYKDQQLEKAVHYFVLAIKTHEIHSDKPVDADYLYNLAETFAKQSKLEQSLQTFKKALEIEESKGKTGSLEYFMSLDGILRICLKTSRYADLEKYTLKEIELKKHGWTYGPSVSDLYADLYYYCLAQGKKAEAKRFLKLEQNSRAASVSGTLKPAKPH